MIFVTTRKTREFDVPEKRTACMQELTGEPLPRNIVGASDSSSFSSDAALIGGIVGGIVAVLLLVLLALAALLWQRKKLRKGVGYGHTDQVRVYNAPTGRPLMSQHVVDIWGVFEGVMVGNAEEIRS